MSKLATALCERLGIGLPIIQAPMAGISTPALAAAVSNAGGLGSLGCAAFAPDELGRQIEAVRGRTNQPVNLNFFCHQTPAADPDRVTRMLARLEPYFAELDVVPPAQVSSPYEPFDEARLEILLDARPAVVSFHYGLPDEQAIGRLKDAGGKVLGSATTVEEALWLEARGVDAVIAQGYEAGGHRGTFLSPFEAAQIGTLALVPQVVDAVRVPVIAAGGIGDGRGIAAALVLGAAGAQLGTAFVTSPESNAHPSYKEALTSGAGRDARVTRAFSGRPARVLANRYVVEMAGAEPDTPAFPLQVSLARTLNTAALERGSTDFMPMWAGQAAPLAKPRPAAELLQALASEAEAALS